MRLPLITLGRRSRVAVVVLAVVVALAGVANLVVLRLTALPSDAALRVGSETVTESQFGQRENLLTGLYGAQAPPDGPDADRFRRDAAQAVATSLVIDQYATAHGLRAPDADAQGGVEAMINSGRFAQGRQGFGQALAALRVSEDDVREEIRRQLTAGRVYDQVTAGTPPVSDQDVAAAYEQRRAEFVVPERRHLRNIVVENADQGNALVAQLRGGGDFVALAAQSSKDKSTSGSGGDLGTLAAEQLEKPVADAAFAAPAGAVFGPVQTKNGWNVGQVLEVQPSQALSLDQVRDQLRAKLTDERRNERWRPWLTDQVRQADVEYAERYRPASPDVLPDTLQR